MLLSTVRQESVEPEPGLDRLIEQTAIVTRTDAGKAWISLGGQSGCSACDAGQGCGAGLFGRLLRRRAAEFEVANSIQAGPGQLVVVGIPEGAYLALVVSIYGLPLLAALAGAVIGHYIAVVLGVRAGWLDLATLITGLAFSMLCWRKLTAGVSSRLAGVALQLLAETTTPSGCAARRQTTA